MVARWISEDDDDCAVIFQSGVRFHVDVAFATIWGFACNCTVYVWDPETFLIQQAGVKKAAT